LKNRESQFAMMASRAPDARAFENGDGKMIDLDIPRFCGSRRGAPGELARAVLLIGFAGSLELNRSPDLDEATGEESMSDDPDFPLDPLCGKQRFARQKQPFDGRFLIFHGQDSFCRPAVGRDLISLRQTRRSRPPSCRPPGIGGA
jgi:hypothetical protein